MAHTRTWDASYEADPADGDQVSGGATDIRQTKQDTRERLEYDHSWAGNDDDGYHKKVTFVDPLAAKPTQADDQTYLYTKDVDATSELFFEDESGNEVQLTKAGATQSFPVGTKMLFYQSSAPTGWTLDVTVDDRVITVDATGGGTTGGSGDITSGSFTVNNESSHTHTVAGTTGTPNEGDENCQPGVTSVARQAHGHDFSVTSGAGSAHGHTVPAPAYAKVIIATKD